MKNPYLKNLNRIEFSITYHCTSHCKHCSVGTKSKEGMRLSPSKASSIIKKVCQDYTISSVMAFGGEPLLFPSSVYAIFEAAYHCGVKTRQIITNGCFSKDKNKIAAICSSLISYHANNILLSVDAFHAEFLPLEFPYYFAKTLCENDFKQLKLHPSWLVSEQDENPYNHKTQKCLNYFADLNLPINQGNIIFPSGNATCYLKDYFEKNKFSPTFTCGDAPYTSPLDDIRSISIDPNGDVYLCSFAIGNVLENDINTILGNYDPYAMWETKAILQGGIAALCDLAKQQGIIVSPQNYYSPCDLCHDVMAKLAHQKSLR